MLNKSIEISDEVLRQAHEDHLLVLLASPLAEAAQAEVSTYYPNGSILAMFPSDADLKKARAAVIEKARKSDYANLVPSDSELRPLFEKKKALHWAFLNEAVKNINTHSKEIGGELLNGNVPTRILALKADGADSHNKSRHTMIVETDAGKFLYKPRSLKPAKVMKELCDDLFPGMFYVPHVLDYKTFGFCEFIDNVDPAGEDELNAYFKALGAYCALAYFLPLSDQHAENFLSRGPKPVPIDLENILECAFKLARYRIELSQMADTWYRSDNGGRFSHDMQWSIISTGMLTCMRGNIMGSILAGTLHKIEQVNTRRETLEHKDQIVAGFEQGYETCLKNRERIRTAVTDLQGTHLRVIVTSTTFYHIILKRLFDASAWKTSKGPEAVSHSLHLPVHTPLGEPIINSETASILNGDIPIFYFVPEEKALFDDNGVVDPDYLDATPLDIALERLETLNEKDLRFQSCVLRKSIENMPLLSDDNPAPIEISDEPLAYNDARAEAARILSLTYADIIPGRDSQGGLWTTHYGETDKSMMDCSLSTGYAGVGVFAAACMATHVGERHHAEKLLDISLHEIALHVKAMPQLPLNNEAGLANGLGGIIRALQLIWIYTEDKRVPDLYADLLHFIENADLTKINGNNVYNGLAGLLITLTDKIVGLPEYKDIESIGDALLERASTDKDGHRVWTEKDGECGEVGYGKGTGGIGLALLKAWQATGEKRFRDACYDAIAYEDSRYNAELSFWPLNKQTGKKKASPPGICRGVSGQAIVFTQAAKADVPLAKSNIERARKCALALPPELNDNLCCGTSAIVEGLMILGCHKEAGKILSGQVNRRKELGQYITENKKRLPFFNPNLFYGCLGVGYELLRYAEPEKVKSVFI